MGVEQYGVRQDGMFVAKVDVGAEKERAKREAMHYLTMYAQDGPAELWFRNQYRKWKNTGIAMAAQPPQEG